jgi:hypothetical protein
MQQGPQMQNFLQMIRQNAERGEFIPYFIKNEQGDIDVKLSMQSLVHYVRTEAGKRKISLNETQALLILQQKNCTSSQVIALGTKALNPNITVALRMAVAVILSTISPSAAGKGISLDVTRGLLHHFLDKKLGVFTPAVDVLCGMDMFLGDYGIRAIGGQAATYAFEQYGRLGYIALPLAILLYTKGPSLLNQVSKQLNDSHLLEAGGDLIDMMGGFADDETYEKYRGSLATMTPEEVVSAVVGGVTSTATWLWNKVPAIRTQAPVLAIEATPVERALPRLN